MIIDADAVFLPIVSKVRELDAKLLLACHFARLATSAVVGEAGPVNGLAYAAPAGIYISPILVPDAAPRLRRLRQVGHTVLAWDEEGLVYPDPAFYVGDRLDAKSVEVLHQLVTWGDQQADDIHRIQPRWTIPVSALGNPRIDLLRPPFRDLYRDAIGTQPEPYLLVNTNFDLVNHADGEDAFRERLRKSRRISTLDDERQFEDWAQFRREIFTAFLDGLPALCEAFPELPIIIRPHPSERLSTWFEFAANIPSVRIAPPTDSVVPWILGATAVLHNSCTTAVEAYVLGVPAISYRPRSSVQHFESPLPNELSICASSWPEVVSALRSVLDAPYAPSRAQVGCASRHIASLEGPYASERIAECALELHRSRSRDDEWDHRLVEPPELSRPRFVPRLVRKGRRLIHRASEKTQEQQQRFPGLTIEEVRSRTDRFARVLGTGVQVTELDAHAFLIEPRPPSRAGEPTAA